jgi:hypothetical protein
MYIHASHLEVQKCIIATKHPKVYRRQIVAEQTEYIQRIQKGIGVMAAMGIEIREGM